MTTSRKEELIKELKLGYLDGESGYLRVLSESKVKVTENGEELKASNTVYYLLTKELPINYVHLLESDDYHILVEGGSADYYFFMPDGSVDKQTIGTDLSKNQKHIVHCPAGAHKAIILHEGVEFALLVNVLTPGWTPNRCTIGADESFVNKFEGKAEWATREFLLKVIGPNFGKVHKASPNNTV